MSLHRIHVIDSHTGGEPTRVVITGGPDLGGGSVQQQMQVFREHFDPFRRAIIMEPRGSDVLVGALLCEPQDNSCATGVIFFDNAKFIGMCGHGTIGLIVTLAHLGRIQPGEHRIETPVGLVTATLRDDGSVSVRNVPSHRQAKDVCVKLDDGRTVCGDVAYGGNWFYILRENDLELELCHVEALTDFTWRVRQAINSQGHPEVDHVILMGQSDRSGIDAKNFVLCPGKAYDRSPCGTGTSAILACLAADEKLLPGKVWRQESIIGSVFEACYETHEKGVVPTITGSAFITAESTLILHPNDPFQWGIA
jgi:4-hydroxyproline epimerase